MPQSQPPSEILPYLYIGGVGDSLNQKLLADLKITHVLNVRESPPHPHDQFKGSFLHVAISDYGGTDLRSAVPACISFINTARDEGGHMLIHCAFGQNRSPTVVVAYLMLEFGWELQKALEFVSKRRAKIGIIPAYLTQLQALQEKAGK